MEKKKLSKNQSIPADEGTYPNIIKESALELGLNIPTLARVMDMASLTLYTICAGKRQPSMDTIIKLEVILKKPIRILYPESEKDIHINWEVIPKVTNENAS